eukprot:Skav210673  [mRNA]  locus=scaffold5572:12149:13141:- [translate_table: standard]
MDKAVDLVAPSSSAAHPKPSGVNTEESMAPPDVPETPRRSPRLHHQSTTPSPVRRPSKSQKPAADEGKQKTPSPRTTKPAAKSPPQQTLPPVLKKRGRKPGQPASKSKASKTLKGPKTKQGSMSLVAASGVSTLRQSNRGKLASLRPALTQVPAEAFQVAESPAKRPRRCRMPPLQSWRNERPVFERVAGSMTPRLAAVELNMSPLESSCRKLQLPALQPPLESMEASEFVGISTEIFTSKLFALPLAPRVGSPCTVVLRGVGIIHVLDGSLRFAKEGEEKKEEIVSAGGTRLVKDPGPKLLAPAEKATTRAEEGLAGVRFRWLECKRAK